MSCSTSRTTARGYTYERHAASRAAEADARIDGVPLRLVDEGPMPELCRFMSTLASPRHVGLAMVPIHDLWSAHQLSLGFRPGRAFDPSERRHDMLKPLDHFTGEELAFEAALTAGDLRVLRDVLATRYRLRLPSAVGRAPFDRHAIARGVAALLGDATFLEMAGGPIHDNWRAVRERLGLVLADDHRSACPLGGLKPRARSLLQRNIEVDLRALVLVEVREVS
jgi:hypothetical protein